MAVRILLVLPCNRWVRLGNYGLGDGWRLVYKWLRDYVDSGLVDLAAVDSCKPGLVYWGEEDKLRWCDTLPYWDRLYSKDPFRLSLLVEALKGDLSSALPKYSAIAYYVNVRAYRVALEEASKSLGIWLYDAGPPSLSPLSFRSRQNLSRLRNLIGVLHGLARAGPLHWAH
ncbi:MAG: hypothetical protein F7C07_03165 [Desulfurococcales archaeon]|nr:hypothetical protein [Desulfurococcales archaeon]